LTTTSKVVQAQINISQTNGEKITIDLTDIPLINDDIDTADRALISLGISGSTFYINKIRLFTCRLTER